MKARRSGSRARCNGGAQPLTCRRAGFTLIELMIVVVIVGILAALALPGYRNYVNQTRANEGVHVLQTIGMRQESYYAEFGRYVNLIADNEPYPGTGDWSSKASFFIPDATLQGSEGAPFPTGANNLNTYLGIETVGRTYLSYTCVSGGPGTAPGDPVNMAQREWWVAAALADLDDDGTYLTIELTSQSRHPWFSAPSGYE